MVDQTSLEGGENRDSARLAASPARNRDELVNALKGFVRPAGKPLEVGLSIGVEL
jgi:hypothetical protein